MNRREIFKSVLPISLYATGIIGVEAAKAQTVKAIAYAKGIEGQRKPDLGNGYFLNPIVSGDRPDPSILKDGKDYYMVHSTFEAYPGLLIWHSRDLVNWTPLMSPLVKYIGSVWAPDIIKHKGRFYIYIPVKFPGNNTSYVIYADNIMGPWSDPIDLKLPKHIDPGHAIGEDGKRYLFLSSGDRARLSDDGLSVIGEVEHVYDPWRYPDDWEVEGFAPEGPKITRHGEYYYLITAVGGTAGPPTGHMVIAARSKSIHGPWQQHPRNPLVRTVSNSEKWWSRGHATLVEGPNGQWYGVYHGYENGFWTLGRQTLLAPIKWTSDGWFDFLGGDLSMPIKKPINLPNQKHGMALSDDFSTNKYGIQWAFVGGDTNEVSRISYDNGLHLQAKGIAPSSSPPLAFVVGDTAYEVEVEIEISQGARGGLILFYDKMLYAGLGFDENNFITHQYGIERGRPKNPHGRRMFIRMRNNKHIVSLHTSSDGKNWKRFDRGMEVSGYHHNVRGGFMMLKPAIYSTGEGKVIYRNLKYKAL